MTDTLLAEDVPVAAEAPPEPQADPTGPQEPAPDMAPPAPILETAFVVYMNPQGHWMIAADVHLAAEMQIARQPNVDDFFSGCSTVLRDIAVQETAATATAMLQQSLQQMAEKARQEQLNQQIAQFTQGGGSGAGAIDLSTLGRRP
jgi:hypothetical protein